MEVPRCPDLAHAGGRVVRAGWYGRPPHRRQRWLCRPKGGEAHRFTELLPRREADRSVCRSCLTQLEPWEGQPGPRSYSFTAREIAHLLVRVAEGSTYRSAAQAVRRLAGRPEAGRPAPAGARRSLSEGQLAANWVDCFADVVTARSRAQEWPAIVVLDAMAFQVVSGPNAGRRFQVLAAVGHAKRGAPQRVVLFEPAPQKNLVEWKAFLGQLPGQPEVVVSDMDAAIGRAVNELFPDAEQRWSEFHLKRSLENSLPECILEDDDHPVGKAFEFAFTAPNNYATFEAAVQTAAASEPGYSGALEWLDRNGPRILAQTTTRTLAGPNSTGGCEAALGQVARRLAARTGRMTNRARLRRLLALIAAEINGEADAQSWTEQIQTALSATGGKPAAQRTSDDPLGVASLLGPPKGTNTRPPARRAEVGLAPALAPRRGEADELPF
jgi:Transposase, Mutator family